MNFKRNNLDKASSPYLQQHKDNPVFWQEWNNDTLEYARNSEKPLLVSIGYSTCHWCHVMARESFSIKTIADFLNENFIAVKVDREERPDIDQFAMNYLITTTGQGGWPLNIFLSPELKPFFAGTYFPLEESRGLPGFLEVLKQVLIYYKKNRNNLDQFEVLEKTEEQGQFNDQTLVAIIKQNFDYQYYGFGYENKFPPYNTLLYLMYHYEVNHDPEVIGLITKTLDAMSTQGLHDHLQGGFYRYCVDRQWTIPHFEKMLYDQGMLLWVFSLSYQLFKRESDKKIVNKIIDALVQTFLYNNMYYAGHNADTNNKEGQTYLWDKKELQDILSIEEYNKFSEVYDLEKGMLNKKIHLLKHNNKYLPVIEKKLLEYRNKRPQPFTDKKIITSWNSLVGIGLIFAYRYTQNDLALNSSKLLAESLLNENYAKNKLFHASIDGEKQAEGFLEDYAAMVLFLSYLYEEEGLYEDELKELLKMLAEFYKKNSKWIMNPAASDFRQLPADNYDHPQPSSVALAEYAIYRTRVLFGLDAPILKEESPFIHDFYNLVALLSKGNAYEIHTPLKINWDIIPITSMQIIGKRYQICHKFYCREFKSKETMLKDLQK